MVDYWPRRLDLAALKAGNLAEVLNLAPWGSVLLQLPPLRLSGARGWAALGEAVGEHWLRDITTNQVKGPPLPLHHGEVTRARLVGFNRGQAFRGVRILGPACFLSTVLDLCGCALASRTGTAQVHGCAVSGWNASERPLLPAANLHVTASLHRCRSS
jgi:hypothetical protein